ncbi:MAG: DUF2288 domain-containing protein [Proteobacteria bacterium]|nr:DUF2288 domain-containing protein [Pseudomonadota bacterium]
MNDLMDLKFKEEEVYKSIREKLEAEIAPVAWEDLQRVFAMGIALFVDPELDLVDAAVEIAEDNTTKVEEWMSQNKITHITDQQAREWNDSKANLLTAIIKPWVLVQPHKVS